MASCSSRCVAVTPHPAPSTLTGLQVRTDASGDADVTSQKDKDPKSLSGGEKSFSTICLLLSLWEAINCPIRCLDEFDVFMDPVNRKIASHMLIDAGKLATTQYILISPLGVAYSGLGA